jgi:cytochrome P450
LSALNESCLDPSQAAERIQVGGHQGEFEAIIDELLETRQRAGAGPETDLTAALMNEKVWGRLLSNEELASILRNWTVGAIGTISAAVGIVAHYLATHSELQKRLRAGRDLPLRIRAN